MESKKTGANRVGFPERYSRYELAAGGILPLLRYRDPVARVRGRAGNRSGACRGDFRRPLVILAVQEKIFIKIHTKDIFVLIFHIFDVE